MGNLVVWAYLGLFYAYKDQNIMDFHLFFGYLLVVFMTGFVMALVVRLFSDLFFDYDDEKRLKINFKRD
jgi:uncharacterized membrane protein